MRKYVHYFDFLRLIAALSVVYMHRDCSDRR